MKLYCVRHGHAGNMHVLNGEYLLNGQGEKKDSKVVEYLAHRDVRVSHIMQHEYPLTEKGKQEVLQVAGYLAYCDLGVSRIMHSAKLCAKQSADIFSKALAVGHSSELCELLNPGRLVTSLVEKIQNWNDDTMLVGHMPLMSQLVNKLILNDNSYSILRFSLGTVPNFVLKNFKSLHINGLRFKKVVWGTTT